MPITADQITEAVAAAHTKHKKNRRGKNAGYIECVQADGLVGPRKKYEKLSDSVVQSHRLPAVYPWHAGDTRL